MITAIPPATALREIVTLNLDALARLYAERDHLARSYQEQIDKLISPEIKVKMDEIAAEMAQQLTGVNANIAEAERSIKIDILTLGESVKGVHLHAVWTKGRTSWNTKALEGFAAAHPEINQFRSEGEPSVSIRAAK